jgi:hypothetical protein
MVLLNKLWVSIVKLPVCIVSWKPKFLPPPLPFIALDGDHGCGAQHSWIRCPTAHVGPQDRALMVDGNTWHQRANKVVWVTGCHSVASEKYRNDDGFNVSEG